MSADNYILVDKGDDLYRVWGGSASVDEHPGDYTTPMKETADVFEAVNFAYEECENGIVEYGVSLTPEVRADMEKANDSMTAKKLMGRAWGKSDRAENSKDRDGWSFVADHATEILALMKGE